MQEELQARKKRLRREILVRREKLTAEEREKATILLADRILAHPWYVHSNIVLGFASYGSEISTDHILTDVLQKGGCLYLPKVEGSGMKFYRVTDLAKLQTGYKGIREPAGDTECYEYHAGERAFLLMPGVAFDAAGYRMGYGKGFYDRFLSDKPELSAHSIAVGFQCQMVDTVPHGELDIRPAEVIAV